MTIISRRVLALLAFMWIITVVGFAVSFQGIRLGQRDITQNVTNVTQQVSRSPCVDMTRAACFHRLAHAATDADLQYVVRRAGK
jgi:hypothetical protein